MLKQQHPTSIQIQFNQIQNKEERDNQLTPEIRETSSIKSTTNLFK